MRVCRLVGGGRIIESQSTDGDLEVLRQNAISSGYAAEDVEVLEMTEAELAAALAIQDAPRRMVSKSTIIARLNAAGKLAAAKAALDQDLFTRERWYAPDRPAIYFDDPEAIALLQAIGADPAVILAE